MTTVSGTREARNHTSLRTETGPQPHAMLALHARIGLGCPWAHCSTKSAGGEGRSWDAVQNNQGDVVSGFELGKAALMPGVQLGALAPVRPSAVPTTAGRTATQTVRDTFRFFRILKI